MVPWNISLRIEAWSQEAKTGGVKAVESHTTRGMSSSLKRGRLASQENTQFANYKAKKTES